MSFHFPSKSDQAPVTFNRLEKDEFDIQRKKILDQSSDLSLNETMENKKNNPNIFTDNSLIEELRSEKEKTYFYEQRLDEYEHMIENLESQLKSYENRLEISENEIRKLENLNKKAYINNNKLQNIVNMLENRENDYKR